MFNLAFNLKNLPVPDRVQLVEDIWDSIAQDALENPMLTTQQIAVLNQRVQAHQANPRLSIAWQEVRATLFAQ